MNTRSGPLLGPAWPDLGWVPAPRYLMRRAMARPELLALRRGRLLEVGCGAGALLQECRAEGFSCTGLEASPEALALARDIDATTGAGVTLRGTPGEDWDGGFSTVVALEVLEHIEDDAAALAQWRRWMSDDGRLVLSVPAHRSRWGPADEWAGHVRRYDRGDLVDVLHRQGFSIDSIACYGFPVGNVLDAIGQRHYRRAVIRDAHGHADRAANNDRSGIDRKDVTRLHRVLSSLPSRLLLRAAFACQRWFARTDLGIGYLVVARKQ